MISVYMDSEVFFAAAKSERTFVFVFLPATKTVVLSLTKIRTRLRPRLPSGINKLIPLSSSEQTSRRYGKLSGSNMFAAAAWTGIYW